MEREVTMGEMLVTQEPDTLTASSVGSCVVIMLHDPKHKISAMLHPLLPKSMAHQPAHSTQTLFPAQIDVRYVDIAIEEAVKKMLRMGVRLEDIEAKLIGGANMFGFTDSDIGQDNVKSARLKLKEVGIKLLAESVGGSQGRSVEFSCASGIVTVKIEF
jgi:chemotaxis protein CheD